MSTQLVVFEQLFFSLFIFVLFTLNSHCALASPCPEHCQCPMVMQEEIVKIESMECSVPDTLDGIPQLMEHANGLINMTIRNQPRLVHLNGLMLQNYTNLRLLEIESSGLKFIAEDSFLLNRKVKRLHLKKNRIERFQKRLISQLNITELWLEDNILACNCSNWWLGQAQEIPKFMNLGSITCLEETSSPSGIQNSSIDGDDYHGGENFGKSLANLNGQCTSPEVFIKPSKPEVRDGNNVNFTCQSKTSGPLTIQWVNLGTLASKAQISSDDKGSSLLQISGVDVHNHFKTVSCRAFNDFGESEISTKILVPSPPVIQEMKLREEAEIRVLFRLSGWPKPKLTWYKDGEISTSLPHIKDYLRKSPNMKGQWLGMRQFEAAVPTIAGNYTLVAENSEGSSNQTVEVMNGARVPPEINVLLNPKLPLAVKNFRDQTSRDGPETGNNRDDKNMEETSEVNATSNLRNDADQEINEVLMIIVPSIVGTVAVIFIIVFAMFVFRRRKRNSRVTGRCDRKVPFANRKHDNFRETVPLTGVQLVENPNYDSKNKKGEQLKSSGLRYIKLETILLMQQIGEGAFGHVLLGKCAHLFKKDEFTNVAVKTLKGDSEEAIKKDFEREAELLATLHHPNIVNFFGVCTEGEHWMMLFEFMEYGDLNNYLRTYGPHSDMLRSSPTVQKNEVLSIKQLLNIVLQISKGMEYLASQHFVHRDLATRNCLVGEGRVVKIGDFGMSKDVYITDYYRVGDAAILPVRWMPPESIMYRTFTVKSDVWSFGVTLWEVFTYGTQPWFEYSNLEVIEHIKNCRHLSKPNQCPEGVYSVMLGCWKPNPLDRLTMKEINRQLQLEVESSQPTYLDVIA